MQCGGQKLQKLYIIIFLKDFGSSADNLIILSQSPETSKKHKATNNQHRKIRNKNNNFTILIITIYAFFNFDGKQTTTGRLHSFKQQ